MCIEANQKDFIMFIKLVKENDTPVLLLFFIHMKLELLTQFQLQVTKNIFIF